MDKDALKIAGSKLLALLEIGDAQKRREKFLDAIDRLKINHQTEIKKLQKQLDKHRNFLNQLKKMELRHRKNKNLLEKYEIITEVYREKIKLNTEDNLNKEQGFEKEISFNFKRLGYGKLPNIDWNKLTRRLTEKSYIGKSKYMKEVEFAYALLSQLTKGWSTSKIKQAVLSERKEYEKLQRKYLR